ncbi:MAG TPA: hypothetical protein VFI02_04670 [Armatimonadota bacterium]|nr:hypothetical protein [Armatimonadota bacterium]
MDPKYPTAEHEAAAHAAVDFFAGKPETQAVLLTCSCAREKASRDSCLDITVLVLPGTDQAAVKRAWSGFSETQDVFTAVRQVGEYSHVDLELTDGCFAPGYHGWTSGPDNFELEIGNTLAYTVPLWQKGDCLQRLKDQWLPYYNETLRKERLAMVVRYCLNNLDHISLFVDRGLYFQAFDRLYHALGEFLQALFISRRTYPIAYDKWVKEQIVEILGLPKLYPQLPRLLEIRNFESQEIALRAEDLRRLLEEYVIE